MDIETVHDDIENAAQEICEDWVMWQHTVKWKFYARTMLAIQYRGKDLRSSNLCVLGSTLVRYNDIENKCV